MSCDGGGGRRRATVRGAPRGVAANTGWLTGRLVDEAGPSEGVGGVRVQGRPRLEIQPKERARALENHADLIDH